MANDDRNPYLILRLPYGADTRQANAAFAKASVKVRAGSSTWTLEDLSWALNQIENAESRYGEFSLFRLPANLDTVFPSLSEYMFSHETMESVTIDPMSEVLLPDAPSNEESEPEQKVEENLPLGTPNDEPSPSTEEGADEGSPLIPEKITLPTELYTLYMNALMEQMIAETIESMIEGIVWKIRREETT